MAKAFQVDTGGTLLDGLLAYYKLEDRTEYYVGGGTYDFTEYGSPTYVAAKVNNGLNLDDSYNQYDKIANNLGFDVNVSVAGWVKLSVLPTGPHFAVVDISNLSHIVDMCIRVFSASIVLNRRKNGVGEEEAVYTFAVATGVWYHFVGTYDGANLRLYVNGVLRAGPTAASGNGSVSGFDGFKISGLVEYDTLMNLSGIFDEWGVWNRALIQQEITDLYNGGEGQTMTELVAGARSHGFIF